MWRDEYKVELLETIESLERDILKLKNIIYKLNERIAYVTNNPDSTLMICEEHGFHDVFDGVMIGDARFDKIMRDGK